jgi:hypothetical protein
LLMFMCFDLRDVFREVIVTAAEIFVVILTLTFFGSAFALAAHSRRQASRAEVPSASERLDPPARLEGP